mmetsp:Transcript_6913/g.16623  ORF Transcript_6913/g.16623 Transcript_6913/m.16623 type:complete len:1317 (-) Transcript_6913:1319-5269(-)
MVDRAELGQKEVEHGTLGRLKAVELARDGDLLLSLLADLHRHVDLTHRLLGLLEALDQRHVGEDVLRRVREALEEVVLELEELDLVLRELGLQRSRLLLEVGPLGAHHLGQELVLETGLGGDEVDEGALGRDLGLVVRVGQLGLEEELEAHVVLDLLAAQLEEEAAPLLVDRAREHRIERGVDVHTDVLDDDRVAVGDGRLELAEPVLLGELEHHEAVVLLALAQPLDTLHLRVDDQRPPLTLGDDGTVLERHGVIREALADHLGVERGRGQLGERRGARGHRDLEVHEVLHPPRLPEGGAVRLVEGADVRYEAGGNHTVAHQGALVEAELVDVEAPALVLAGKTANEAHGEAELGVAAGGLGLDLGLLLGRGHKLGLEGRELRLDGGHRVLRLLELSVGGRLGLVGRGERVHERFHLHVDAVVRVDVDDPVAKVRGGGRLGGHGLEVEALHLDERPQLLDLVLGHGRAVVVLELLDERVDVVHHLLGHVPLHVVLVVVLDQDEAARRHVLDAARRLLQTLELRKHGLVQAVDGGGGGEHGRLGLRELLVGLGLDLEGLGGLDAGELGGLRRALGEHLGLGALDAHVLDQHVGGGLLLLDLLHGVGQVDLELGHVARGLAERREADVEAVDLHLDLAALHANQILVEGDELEERLGRHVVEATLRLLVVGRGIGDREVLLGHVLGEGRDDDFGVLELEVGAEEALGHRLEGVARPRVEHVDRGAVDQAREAARAHAEGVADRREGEHDLEHGAAALDQKLEHRLGVVRHARGLGLAAKRVVERVDVLLGEEVRDPARGEHGVQVDQELVVDDLAVGHEERDRDLLHDGELVVVAEVLLEVLHTVRARHLDLLDLVAADERREAAEALLAGAADADEHGVTARLAQHARAARDVLDRVLEEDEVHAVGKGDVVLLEVVVEDARQLGHVGRLLIVLNVGTRLQEVDEDDRLGAEDGVGLERGGEGPALDLHDNVGEPLLVGRVREAVVEDALDLVDAELAEVVRTLYLPLVNHEHTLKHLADVTQVERVVKLGGRRQELGRDAVVHLDGASHKALGHLLDLGVKLLEESLENRCEDERHGLVRGRWHAQHREVAREARRDLGAAAARRRGAGEHDRVDDVLPEELVAVVEALEVEELAEQLDRRLGAVGLSERHVHVIDEDQNRATSRRAEQRLALLLELALDGGLRDERRGLGRVAEEQGQQPHPALLLGRLEIAEELRDHGGLTRAGEARDEDAMVHLDHALHKERVADRVGRGNDEAEEGHRGVVVELGDDLGPRHELLLGNVDEVVEHGVHRRERDREAALLEGLLDKDVELLP